LPSVHFVAMCVAVFLRAPATVGAGDYAYRASIVALSQGHLLLTNAQYLALQLQLSVHGGGGISQWIHLANGKWISQKNPAIRCSPVAFQMLHALRWAPLFYGAIGCGDSFTERDDGWVVGGGRMRWCSTARRALL